MHVMHKKDHKGISLLKKQIQRFCSYDDVILCRPFVFESSLLSHWSLS